jgi:hypothetical protein
MMHFKNAITYYFPHSIAEGYMALKYCIFFKSSKNVTFGFRWTPSSAVDSTGLPIPRAHSVSGGRGVTLAAICARSLKPPGIRSRRSRPPIDRPEKGLTGG